MLFIRTRFLSLLTRLVPGGLALDALGVQRLAWFGAGLSAGVAAWLAGEVALGPLVSGHPTAPPRPSPAPVRIQVDGAVERPGVYELPQGARVEDALRAAGGVAERADTSDLNLVARLADGQRIVVPGRTPPDVSGTPAPRDRPRLPTRTPTVRPVTDPTAGPRAADGARLARAADAAIRTGAADATARPSSPSASTARGRAPPAAAVLGNAGRAMLRTAQAPVLDPPGRAVLRSTQAAGLRGNAGTAVSRSTQAAAVLGAAARVTLRRTRAAVRSSAGRAVSRRAQTAAVRGPAGGAVSRRTRAAAVLGSAS